MTDLGRNKNENGPPQCWESLDCFGVRLMLLLFLSSNNNHHPSDMSRIEIDKKNIIIPLLLLRLSFLVKHNNTNNNPEEHLGVKIIS